MQGKRGLFDGDLHEVADGDTLELQAIASKSLATGLEDLWQCYNEMEDISGWEIVCDVIRGSATVLEEMEDIPISDGLRLIEIISTITEDFLEGQS